MRFAPNPDIQQPARAADQLPCLGQFSDNSINEIYASHVFEHLSHANELPETLKETRRILKPGGILRVSVPDFELLCRMFVRSISKNATDFVPLALFTFNDKR